MSCSSGKASGKAEPLCYSSGSLVVQGLGSVSCRYLVVVVGCMWCREWCKLVELIALLNSSAGVVFKGVS